MTFNINNSIPPSADEEPQEEQKPDEQEVTRSGRALVTGTWGMLGPCS